MKKAALIILLLINVGSITVASAQCAMCTAAAESGVKSKGHKTGLGLNSGVLLLLAMPYAAFSIIGILWYKNARFQRKKRIVAEGEENV